MTEEKNDQYYMRELSREEVVEFFKEHNVSSACPSCQHDVSAIHTRLNGPVAGFGTPSITIDTEKFTGALDDGKFSMFMVAECENCGYLRQFSYLRIMRWANARRLA